MGFCGGPAADLANCDRYIGSGGCLHHETWSSLKSLAAGDGLARKQLFDLSDDLATKVTVVFYTDAREALLKALTD